MKLNRAKTSAAIACLYLLVSLTPAIDAINAGMPFEAVWLIIRQPVNLEITAVCIVLIVILWCQLSWARWLGVAVGTTQLMRIIWFWSAHLEIARESIVLHLLVVLFLLVLCIPDTMFVFGKEKTG